MEHHPESRSCDVCGMVPVAHGVRRADHVVAESPAMQEVFKRAARFAASDAPVVVLGETGAGKEVVARVLHENSPRAEAPFVPVNVAALPAELLESELFGHGRGAFTGAVSGRRGLFEEADGGTLFLDEIGELPMSLQAKLLRALQDGEVRRVGENRAFGVNARVISATHRDLLERVRAGLFREDLYYRLKVLTLEVPPLRERPQDVLPLALQFLADEPRPLLGFTRDAEAALLRHGWPGNVRELHNAVRHGAALASGARVAAADLPDEVLQRRASVAPAVPADSLPTLAEVEKAHVLRVLEACGGSTTRAAQVLGVARNTLWRKVRSYG